MTFIFYALMGGKEIQIMVYGYARVSTKGQAKDGNSLEAQEKSLRDAGAKEIYMDVFTGTKSNRPELNRLLKVMREGDTLVITKSDRIARSAIQGIKLIQSLLDHGITVYVLNMGLMDGILTLCLVMIRSAPLHFLSWLRNRSTSMRAFSSCFSSFVTLSLPSAGLPSFRKGESL